MPFALLNLRLRLLAVCLWCSSGAGLVFSQTTDDIPKKIAAAKETFYAERDKAETALLAALERREVSAKEAGDLKILDAVRAEIAAFRKDAAIPKLVPVNAYETALKTAKSKFENVYVTAIKDYTKVEKLDAARVLQKELDDFRAGRQKTAAAQDPFQPLTVWIYVSGDKVNVLTVTQRQGDTFVAQYKSEERKFDRIVTGKISDGKLTWDSKDVKAIKGSKGPSIVGTFETDEMGPLIKVDWSGNGETGNYILRLKKDSISIRIEQ